MMDPDCIVNGKPSIERVAAKMGWTVNELNRFIYHNQALFQYQESLNNSPEMPLGKATPITDVARALQMPKISDEKPPTLEMMAKMVEAADEKLRLGLDTLELTDEEKRVALSLAKFNNQHFMDSSNMISSSVLVTNLKLASEQKRVEERLRTTREELAKNPENTVARQLWLQEENMLMTHFEALADLQTKIQKNWMEGAAQLAMTQLRLRQSQSAKGKNGSSFRTQRTNKPGFRPNAEVDVETAGH